MTDLRPTTGAAGPKTDPNTDARNAMDFSQAVHDFSTQVSTRLDQITALAANGGLDAAVELMTTTIESGGVIHAFGTGHSEAFAMEIAGRAGGLIPTNKIALRDLVLRGTLGADQLGGSSLERNPDNVTELWELSGIQPGDLLMIASNSGVNGSIVGLALLAKEHGIPLVVVTSLEHTMAVPLKHPSGKRLSDVGDVVIDNLAPYGDATLELSGGVPVGAVSSITAAYIAQLLTIGVSERISADGRRPPLYLSANIPGGDEHNSALEQLYAGRIHRGT
ncbi:SIS domain-containing protein [Microlunatus antarcticus]|uniref:Putative phosphosugar-binding protein n=1 Tax=Microlunatus antarcticus TaxID=53388 RepID=A0A7W5JZ03_9ACTN|nr:putative phosphosugar-binding protein [Microlunatus antarcticus]